MNMRLLISGIIMFLALSCQTVIQPHGYEYENVSIDSKADTLIDQQYENILAPYRNQITDEMNRVIAYSDKALISDRPESPLSNFLSDMILEFGENYSRKQNLNFVPHFSLFNHGGIRASLPEGEIKVLNAFQIMPFENEIVMLQLTGNQVVELANYIAMRRGEGVAGISFGMLEDKAINIKIEGESINANAYYWLVTSDYIANGGDGMSVLTKARQRIDTGFLIRNVLIDMFEQMTRDNETIHAVSDGRLYYAE